MPVAFHIAANIGRRQYFCLVQIFGMSVCFFSPPLQRALQNLKIWESMIFSWPRWNKFLPTFEMSVE
jgi:hypothetical protein